jgi:hypothetical protein
MPFLLNLILFQVCWVAAVAGAGRGLWWAGPVAVVVFAAIVLKMSRWPRADLELIGIAAVIGLAVDSAYIHFGLLTFASPVPTPYLAPIWIVGMWVSFALTLNHSLSFLKGRQALAFVFGLIGGPVAYYVAAQKFGAAQLTASPLAVYGTLAVAWGLVTPILMGLAARRVPVREVPVLVTR